MYLCVMVIKIETQDKEKLREIQRSTHDKGIFSKVSCILGIGNGLSPSEVADMLGLNITTVYRYINSYELQGVEFVKANYFGFYGNLSEDNKKEVIAELTTKLYTKAKDVKKWIDESLNITMTEDGIVKLLNRIGFTYKSTKQIPSKADPEKQISFIENNFKPLIYKAIESNGKIKVYFTDAVHPTHNTRSTKGWIQKGKDFPLLTCSGRDRVNINGALNALDPTEIHVLECETINATSTEMLYNKLMEVNPDAEKIYIIADNARYYKNKILRQYLENQKVEQVFLPPYSPNLNIIERLWKFVRKVVINANYFSSLQEFKEKLMDFFEKTQEYKDELIRLLTLNFPIFNGKSICINTA